MKAINKLIGRFVLAVGLLAVAEAGLSQSATLAETKEFLSRKLYKGGANNQGDPCMLYGYYFDNDNKVFYWTKSNLSTIYLDGISAYDWVTLQIDYTKDAEVYRKPKRSKVWRRSGTRDGGSAYLNFNHHSVSSSKIVAAIKHAARLCGAKATDPTPPLQFE